MSDVLGYGLFFCMGTTFGFFGAGGAILAVPLMVYGFKLPLILATTYSLAIVGCAASVAAWRQRQHIDFSNAIVFGLPAMFGMFLTRRELMPMMPEHLGPVPTESVMVVFLAMLMGLSAYAMIAPVKGLALAPDTPQRQRSLAIAAGLLIGMLMGMVGGGGGFLNVPTLALLLGLTIHRAIATSFAVGATMCAIGFMVDPLPLSMNQKYQLLSFIFLTLCGILVGSSLSQKVKAEKLKKALGYFLLLCAMLIFSEQLYELVEFYQK
ncbi:MAG: sulfite exporter TauE/SafE family protein [Holosporales bacterium]